MSFSSVGVVDDRESPTIEEDYDSFTPIPITYRGLTNVHATRSTHTTSASVSSSLSPSLSSSRVRLNSTDRRVHHENATTAAAAIDHHRREGEQESTDQPTRIPPGTVSSPAHAHGRPIVRSRITPAAAHLSNSPSASTSSPSTKLPSSSSSIDLAPLDTTRSHHVLKRITMLQEEIARRERDESDAPPPTSVSATMLSPTANRLPGSIPPSSSSATRRAEVERTLRRARTSGDHTLTPLNHDDEDPFERQVRLQDQAMAEAVQRRMELEAQHAMVVSAPTNHYPISPPPPPPHATTSTYSPYSYASAIASSSHTTSPATDARAFRRSHRETIPQYASSKSSSLQSTSRVNFSPTIVSMATTQMRSPPLLPTSSISPTLTHHDPDDFSQLEDEFGERIMASPFDLGMKGQQQQPPPPPPLDARMHLDLDTNLLSVDPLLSPSTAPTPLAPTPIAPIRNQQHHDEPTSINTQVTPLVADVDDVAQQRISDLETEVATLRVELESQSNILSLEQTFRDELRISSRQRIDELKILLIERETLIDHFRAREATRTMEEKQEKEKGTESNKDQPHEPTPPPSTHPQDRLYVDDRIQSLESQLRASEAALSAKTISLVTIEGSLKIQDLKLQTLFDIESQLKDALQTLAQKDVTLQFLKDGMIAKDLVLKAIEDAILMKDMEIRRLKEELETRSMVSMKDGEKEEEDKIEQQQQQQQQEEERIRFEDVHTKLQLMTDDMTTKLELIEQHEKFQLQLKDELLRKGVALKVLQDDEIRHALNYSEMLEDLKQQQERKLEEWNRILKNHVESEMKMKEELKELRMKYEIQQQQLQQQQQQQQQHASNDDSFQQLHEKDVIEISNLKVSNMKLQSELNDTSLLLSSLTSQVALRENEIVSYELRQLQAESEWSTLREEYSKILKGRSQQHEEELKKIEETWITQQQQQQQQHEHDLEQEKLRMKEMFDKLSLKHVEDLNQQQLKSNELLQQTKEQYERDLLQQQARHDTILQKELNRSSQLLNDLSKSHTQIHEVHHLNETLGHELELLRKELQRSEERILLLREDGDHTLQRLKDHLREHGSSTTLQMTQLGEQVELLEEELFDTKKDLTEFHERALKGEEEGKLYQRLYEELRLKYEDENVKQTKKDEDDSNECLKSMTQLLSRNEQELKDIKLKTEEVRQQHEREIECLCKEHKDALKVSMLKLQQQCEEDKKQLEQSHTLTIEQMASSRRQLETELKQYRSFAKNEVPTSPSSSSFSNLNTTNAAATATVVAEVDQLRADLNLAHERLKLYELNDEIQIALHEQVRIMELELKEQIRGKKMLEELLKDVKNQMETMKLKHQQQLMKIEQDYEQRLVTMMGGGSKSKEEDDHHHHHHAMGDTDDDTDDDETIRQRQQQQHSPDKAMATSQLELGDNGGDEGGVHHESNDRERMLLQLLHKEMKRMKRQYDTSVNEDDHHHDDENPNREGNDHREKDGTNNSNAINSNVDTAFTSDSSGVSSHRHTPRSLSHLSATSVDKCVEGDTGTGLPTLPSSLRSTTKKKMMTRRSNDDIDDSISLERLKVEEEKRMELERCVKQLSERLEQLQIQQQQQQQQQPRFDSPSSHPQSPHTRFHSPHPPSPSLVGSDSSALLSPRSLNNDVAPILRAQLAASTTEIVTLRQHIDVLTQQYHSLTIKWEKAKLKCERLKRQRDEDRARYDAELSRTASLLDSAVGASVRHCLSCGVGVSSPASPGSPGATDYPNALLTQSTQPSTPSISNTIPTKNHAIDTIIQEPVTSSVTHVTPIIATPPVARVVGVVDPVSEPILLTNMLHPSKTIVSQPISIRSPTTPSSATTMGMMTLQPVSPIRINRTSNDQTK